MLRFQLERPLMVSRRRRYWSLQKRRYEPEALGRMRKHRPFESHPSASCRFCGVVRAAARLERRRFRYGARAMIEEQQR